MFKKAAVLVASCGALLSGCGTGVQSEHEEIIANLVEAGFPASDMLISDDNEGASNVGAIHIPGTPTTASRGSSIMNSCFSSSESGEWSSSDKTALNYLY